jgi:hypothetical protein
MRLDLTEDEKHVLPALLTSAIDEDRHPLPPASAFATVNRDPISRLCTWTYRTKKPPL